MLRVPASLLAIIGSILTTLKSFSIVPMKDAAIDLIILGRIPMTDWRITFEPLFLFLVLVAVGILVKYALVQAKVAMDEVMWNPSEIENVSL